MRIGIWLVNSNGVAVRYDVAAEDIYTFCAWARGQRVAA